MKILPKYLENCKPCFTPNLKFPGLRGKELHRTAVVVSVFAIGYLLGPSPALFVCALNSPPAMIISAGLFLGWSAVKISVFAATTGKAGLLAQGVLGVGVSYGLLEFYDKLSFLEILV